VGVTVQVLFFGHWRDRAGAGQLSLTLSEPATVADAATTLAAQNPNLSGILDKVRVAVGEEFAAPETLLKNGDELAFLPPMSGG
jgi:molybdopterin converting factor subunit 1